MFKAVLKIFNNHAFQTWAVLTALVMLGPSLSRPAWSQTDVPPPPPAASGLPLNPLQNLELDSKADYSQITFIFQEPLDAYTLRRVDLNTLRLNFGAAQSALASPDLSADPLLASLNLIQDKGHLAAEIKIKTTNYVVRHHPSHNKRRVVLDLKALEPEVHVEEGGSPAFSRPRWRPPTARGLAKNVQAELNQGLAESSSYEGGPLFENALEHMVKGHYQTAAAMLEAFKNRYPDHPLIDRAYYLAAYAKAESEPEEERFRTSTAAWREALDKFPESGLAPPAAFSLAQAYLNRNYLPEADDHFKRAASLYPDSPYAQMSLIKAADIALLRNRPAEARDILKNFLERPIQTNLDLDTYARIGLSYYEEGLYAQANDIFKQLLDIELDSYQDSPELIYALGDGHFYLGRPDLSRLFLLHAVNLLPRHPKVDVMMAKIGDTFRLEGRYDEAIAVYNLTAREFAKQPGGLVSQMRLAEMGVLSSFFPASNIFTALQNGSRRATVTMYERIVQNAQEASEAIKQLALLRGGLALEADRDFQGAIDWLGTLVKSYPKGLLLEEAKQALGRTVLSQARLFEELEAWPDLTALASDYEKLLEPEDQNRLKPLAAKAYDALGDFNRGLFYWRAYASDHPEEQLARYMGLITDQLKLDQPLEALDNLKSLVASFPQTEDWAQTQLDAIGVALARPANEAAIDNLKLFRAEIKNFNLRQRALADSIAIALLNNNYPLSRELIDQYRSEYPDDELSPDYLLVKAEIERRLNNPQNAWDALSDFRRQNPDDPRAKEILLAQINEAFGLNRPDDAFRFIELYRLLHPGDPQSPELIMTRYKKEMDLGRTDQALETLARFRTYYPQSPQASDAYYQQYQEEINLGRLEQAALSLDEFRKEHPNDPRLPDLMLGQAQRELTAGQPEKALARWRDFRRTYPEDPRNPEILLDLAKQEGALNRPEKAAELLAEFRRTYPGHQAEPQTYLDQLAWENQRRNYPEMLNLYREFRGKYPDHPETPRLYQDEARLAITLGKIDEARAVLEEGIQKMPVLAQNAEVQEQLGQIYLDQGNVDGWAATLDNYLRQPAAVGDNPEDRFLKAWQLAQVYLELGRQDEARRVLDLALTLEPADIAPEILYNLAKAYETLGERAKYAGVLERLRQSPDALWRGVAQQELNSLNAPAPTVP